MLLASLLGGLFIGVLSALPIVSVGNCCCLWVVGGGFLASYVRAQNDPRAMTIGRGAAAGFGAGLAGAVIWLVVSLALASLLEPFERRLLGDVVGVARDVSPDVRSWIESISAGFKYVVVFGLLLVVGTPMATLGGVLGGAYFRPDVPPALGGPVIPPPLP